MSNEAIARWMGEVKSRCSHDGQCLLTVCEGCQSHYQHSPAYDTDPAAALRVLARMNEERIEEFSRGFLRPITAQKWEVVYWNLVDDQENSVFAPTPCAAIVAAWAAEFGGEHVQG